MKRKILLTLLIFTFLPHFLMAEVKGGDDAADARWFALDQVPPLAFDHDEVLQVALQRLGLVEQ